MHHYAQIFARSALFGSVLLACSSGQSSGLSNSTDSGGGGATASGGSTATAADSGASGVAGAAQGGGQSGASGAAQGGASGASTSLAGGGAAGSLASAGASNAGAPNGGASTNGGASNAGAPNGGASTNGGAGGTTAPAGSGNTAGASSAGAGGGGALQVCNGTPPAKAVTIYTIGDSTMSVYASTLYPRMGWGQPLGDLFAEQCAVVSDKALSGRSSKSFFDEGDWTPVRDALKSGDYVLIQFGHNDEKSDDPTLYTDPETTYKQYLTTYVNDTLAKKAFPILVTSINRNSWSGTTLQDTHGNYPPAVRELAAALKVPLIDLTALTKTYFERIGQTATTKLFMDLAVGQFPNYPDGNTDNTHLQEVGARTIGQLAMSNAYTQKLTLATFLKAVPVAP